MPPPPAFAQPYALSSHHHFTPGSSTRLAYVAAWQRFSLAQAAAAAPPLAGDILLLWW